MTAITSVVVYSRHALPAIMAALEEYAEGHDRGAVFECLTAEKTYLSGMSVIVGQVNHGDHDHILAAIRDGARDPQWSSAFWPTAVVLDHELDAAPPRVYALTES